MTPRDYLASLEFHGIKLGLDNIRFLCEAAGNPHLAHPTVHVAGTNGKGSVLAFLDAMLRAAGYATGRFTSPHLLDVSERFLVNAKPIGDGELDGHIAFFRGVAETMAQPPTYFELATAVAFRWFAENALDAALIEVGMGGRFDSTNVVAPVAACVTNIDLEHTRYLGDTLEKIAFEKAGIIKPNTPVVVAETQAGPRDVILARAKELGAPVRLLGRDFEFRTDGPNLELSLTYESDSLRVGPVRLGLPGKYQGVNAAVAVAMAEVLRERFSGLDEAAIRRGLECAKWPCRLERFYVAATPLGETRLDPSLRAPDPPCGRFVFGKSKRLVIANEVKQSRLRNGLRRKRLLHFVRNDEGGTSLAGGRPRPTKQSPLRDGLGERDCFVGRGRPPRNDDDAQAFQRRTARCGRPGAAKEVDASKARGTGSKPVLLPGTNRPHGGPGARNDVNAGLAGVELGESGAGGEPSVGDVTPVKTVIIDVAHNAAGARRLAEELPECVLVVAVSSDKAAERMVDSLARVARRLILTEFSGARALPLEALRRAAGKHAHEAIPRLADAIEAGLAGATEGCPVVITGSIFTAGEARRILMESYGAPGLEF